MCVCVCVCVCVYTHTHTRTHRHKHTHTRKLGQSMLKYMTVLGYAALSKSVWDLCGDVWSCVGLCGRLCGTASGCVVLYRVVWGIDVLFCVVWDCLTIYHMNYSHLPGYLCGACGARCGAVRFPTIIRERHSDNKKHCCPSRNTSPHSSYLSGPHLYLMNKIRPHTTLCSSTHLNNLKLPRVF